MLTQIHIENFAIVQSLDLEFNSGLTVLTGETGAGKSIWIDAVNLALGARADLNLIGNRDQRCDISLCFNIEKNFTAQNWLREQAMDSGSECIIRRTIANNGNSKSTVNGIPISQNQIRQLAGFLINIHSQHQQQLLLQRDHQQQQLDQIANTVALVEQCAEIYWQWSNNQKQLHTLNISMEQRESELALLRFQLQELDELNLAENEWQELSDRHQKAHQAKKLLVEIDKALELTIESEHSSAINLLQKAIDYLEIHVDFSPQIHSAKQLLETANIHLQEASSELASFRNHLDLSPEELIDIEYRLGKIHDLSRKHHVNPEALTDIQKSLQQKIADLENIDIKIAALQKAQGQLEKQYDAVAKDLTAARNTGAKKLNKTISSYCQNLGMEKAEFRVTFQKNDSRLSASGAETVQFEIRTNPGADFAPMQKVVSGGELSRISLALQVVIAAKENTPTIIFDEVDVGIGGKTAHTVGQLLKQLGENTQVFCITHLAQVAAQGDQHFYVEKETSESDTQSKITLLNRKERIEEIARMLGGNSTKQAIALAKEMLGQASSAKAPA